MKTPVSQKRSRNLLSTLVRGLRKSRSRGFALSAAGVYILAPKFGASAATYTWNGGASGTWDATASNWSGGSGWGAGTTDSAVFNNSGDAATVNGSVALGNLTFSQSATLSSGTVAMSGTLTVASGATVTLGSFLKFTGGYNLISNGLLNLASGDGGNTNLLLYGTGTTAFTSGTFKNLAVWHEGSTINQGAATVAASRIMIGYGGTADSLWNVNSGSSIFSSTADIFLGRAGRKGTLNINAGSVTSATDLTLVFDNTGGSNAALKVAGGSLTVGGTIAILKSGTTANQSAAVAITGGTVSASGIQFGSTAAQTYAPSTSASLTMTGGALYVGPSGIVPGASLPGTTVMNVSGGVIGATTGDWSSAMGMTLGGSNGNITFQAANSSSTARNISLSGILSGTGGFTKTGAGTLTLSGSNSFSGATAINGGILSLGGTNALAGGGNISFGGGTLQYSGGNQIDYSSRIVGSGSAISIDTNGLSIAYGSPLANTNTGGLTKTGSGTLTLTASSAYTGTTTVSSGTLVLGSGGVIGGTSSNLTVSNGAVMSIGNGGILSASGSGINVAGTVNLEGGGQMNVSGGTKTFFTANSATGRITSTGAIGAGGTLYLAAAGGNAYTTGINQTNNTLILDNVVVSSSGAMLFVAAGGSGCTTTLSNGSQATAPGIGLGVNSSNDTLNVNSGSVINALGQNIRMHAGSGTGHALNINGGSVINVGAVDFLYDSNAVSAGSVKITNSGTLSTINASNINSTNGFVSVSGAGSVWNMGTSTLSVGAANAGTSAGQGNYLSISSGGVVTTSAVTLNSSSNSLVFNNGTLAASAAGTLVSGSGFVDVQSGGVIIDSGSFNVTVSSAIVLDGTSAGGGLTKNGSGTLTLSGSNSYSGGVAIGAGLLNYGNVNALGSGTVSFSGNSTLQAGVSSGTLASAIAINPSVTGTVDTQANTVTLGGIVSGSGSLAKTGVGTLTLTGSNSYSGGTTIGGGTLSIASDSAIGGSASSLTFSGGILQVTGTGVSNLNSHTVNWATFNGGIDVNSAANAFTVSQVLSGTGSLTKLGAGTLTLSSSNSYSGGTTIGGGTLSIASDNAIGDSASSLTFSGGILQVTGTGISNLNSHTLNGATFNGGIDVNSAANVFTVSQALSGTGSFTKLGAGTLTLSGSNSYSGGTLVSAGVFQLGNVSALGTGAVVVANGATLDTNGYALPNSSPNITLSGSGVGGLGALVNNTGSNPSLNLTLAADATIGNSNRVDMNSIAGNNHALTKIGAGSLNFWSNLNNNYTFSAVNVQAGIVYFEGSTATTTPFNVSNGAMLGFYAGGTLGSPRTLTAPIVIASSGGTIGSTGGGSSSNYNVFSGPITLNGAATVNPNNTNVTISGAISGAGGMTFTTSGSTSLTGSNSFTGGITINAGTLQIGNGTTDGSITSSSGINNNGVLVYNLVGSQTYGNTISGGGALTKTGAGTLLLTGSNSYTGSTTIAGGTLQIGDGTTGSIAASGSVTVNSGGTLALYLGGSGTIGNAITNLVGGTLNVLGSGTTAFSGYINGPGIFNQNGPGLTILSATAYNFSPGATVNINAGTLQLSSTTAAYNSTVNVGVPNGLTFGVSGATIGGLSGSGNVVLATATSGVTMTVGTNSFNTTYAGVLSGSGSLVKVGSGMLTFTGSNTYTGNTTISSGTLALGAGVVFGGTNGGGIITVAGGALSIPSGAVVTSSANLFVSNGGAIFLENGGRIDMAANVVASSLNLINTTSASGRLTSSGTSIGGIIDFHNSNFWAIATNAGLCQLTLDNVSIQNVSDFEIGRGWGNRTVTFQNGAILNAKALTVSVDASGDTLNIDSGASVNLNGGNLIMHQGGGGGDMMNIDGGIVTNAGAIDFTFTAPNRPGNALVISNGGQLSSLQNSNINCVSGSATVTGTGSLWNMNDKTLSIGAAVITGTNTSQGNSLKIANGGTVSTGGLILGSTNNWVTIDGGTLTAGTNGSLVSGTGYVYVRAAGAVIDTGIFSTTVSVPMVDDPASTGGGLAKVGTGTLTLTAANTFTGTTTANGGTLKLANSLALQNSTLSVNPGAIAFDSSVGAHAFTVGALSGTGNLALQDNAGTPNAVALTAGGNNASTEYSGSLSSGGSLVKTGTGTLILSGSSSYSGGTTVNGGTMNVAGDAALGAVTGAVNLSDGATLQTSGSFGFNASRNFAANSGTATIDTQENINTLNGGLSGVGTLAKSGSGTLILSGSIGIAGLNANSGAVLVTRSGSIGALNVASGATFSMVAHSGSTYNVLNLSSLNISGSASAQALLNADSLNASTDNELLATAGQSATGLGTPVASQAALEPLSPEAVPEPGTIGLLLVGALSLFGLRRKGNKLG